MKTKLLTLLSALFIAAIMVACDKKDDEQPYINKLMFEGEEQTIRTARYGSLAFVSPDGTNAGEKMGFRLSSVAPGQVFDETKDFDIYMMVDTRYMSNHGTNPGKIETIKIRVKDLHLTNNSLDQGLASTGSAFIIMGSYGEAEIRFNMVMRRQELGGLGIIARRFEGQFKGKMERAALFSQI